jgi:hypothetical protein
MKNPRVFNAEQFTGNAAVQAYKAALARRIYLYWERGYTWDDAEFYARVALRHGIAVPGAG